MSLTLRGELGRKLTIEEMDNNFLYVLENATGSGGGGTFSLDFFGYTYSGYSLNFYHFGFLDSSSGTYSVGDIIVGSQSGAQAQIVKIFYDDDPEAFIWLDNVVGTFDIPETLVNQTQAGELFCSIVPLPEAGPMILINIEDGYPYGDGEVISVGTSSMIITTTHSISNYDLIIQNGDMPFVAGIKSFESVLNTTTFSAGLEVGKDILQVTGGVTGMVNYLSDGNSIGFSGIAKLTQPFNDNTVPFMVRSSEASIASKLVTGVGHYEFHTSNVSGGGTSQIRHSFMDGITLEHNDGSCTTTFNVCSTEVSYTRSDYKFYLPDNCPGYYGAHLRGNVNCNNVCMYWDNDQCNTFLGWRAGECNIGNSNTMVGPFAGLCNVASCNTFIGFQSGYSNTCGCKNTFIGVCAGYINNGGYGNVFIGSNSGCSTTGSNNVLIGSETNASGSISNSIVIGSNAISTISGEFVLGSSAWPIQTGSTASVNGGSSDTLGVCYLCITLNGTQYKLPLYQ